MFKLNALSKEGTTDVLQRLSTGEARFKELNEVVTNTKTLTRRLKELQTEGLIRKVKTRYAITKEGFDTLFKIAEFKGKEKLNWIHDVELDKVKYRWMKISLRRLVEDFLKEFDDELISIILYGSATKDTFQLGRSDIDLLYILEDDTTNVWQREENVFKDFQSTWEYKACDYLLKTKGFFGCPEVTTASLHKSHAKIFQPIYLDMLPHRAVLYDRQEFFRKLMKRLQEALKTLGTVRIEHANGAYCWVLKPNMTAGEPIEIDLG